MEQRPVGPAEAILDQPSPKRVESPTWVNSVPPRLTDDHRLMNEPSQDPKNGPADPWTVEP